MFTIEKINREIDKYNIFTKYNTDSKVAFQNNPEHKKDQRFSQETYEKRINRKPVQMYSAPNGGAKCISCGLSNIRRISVASKVGSVALWGCSLLDGRTNAITVINMAQNGKLLITGL